MGKPLMTRTQWTLAVLFFASWMCALASAGMNDGPMTKRSPVVTGISSPAVADVVGATGVTNTATTGNITNTAATNITDTATAGVANRTAGTSITDAATTTWAATGGTGATMTASTGVLALSAAANDMTAYTGSSVYVGASGSSRMTIWDGALPWKTVFLTATSGAASGLTAGTASNIGVFQTVTLTADDDLAFNFCMPEDASTAPTTSVTLYVLWTADSNSGEWQPKVSVRNVTVAEQVDAEGDTQTIDTGDVNAPGTSEDLTRTELGKLTVTPGRRELVSINLERVAVDDGTEIDSAGGEPHIIGIEVRYMASSLGE